VTDDVGPRTLTPSDVRALLDRYGLAPRKADGQNFVVDPNTVRRIVAAAAIGPDDTVLEIGPGLGSLTLPLAHAAGRVVAIEIDAGLAAAARDVTADLGNVDVIHADAMSVDFDALVPAGTRLVANLPYNVATPLLMHALDAEHVADAFVMVQREVGERWAAGPGDPAYGGVSVKIAAAADARIELTIPRGVFHPVPNVDSVMVRVVRRGGLTTAQRRALAVVIEAAFASRRKTLRNNLRAAFGDDGERALAAAGIDPGRRAETLALDDFVALARHLPDVGLGGGPA
jgi:16S rRNA (adenine1518-N6/adenine1519-N6)-dimethyltransferase